MRGILETVHLSSAFEFLEYLQPRKQHWLPYNASTIPWVFRGQSKATWDLIPSALRKDQKWFESFENSESQNVLNFLRGANVPYKDAFQPDIHKLSELILQIAAEWNAADEFIELADQVGHQIPSDEGAFLDANTKLT